MTVTPKSSAGRVVFVGAVHEARPALSALLGDPRVIVTAVLTPPPGGGATLSGRTDLAPLAAAAGVPVLPTEDVNAPATVAAVRALEPDLLAVVGWTRLLGDELLAVPTHGCVGFHASLLPRHRGRAPVNWAIIKGETLTGNTMLMLDPGADTGDIVDQRPVAIDPQDTCATVYRHIARAGAEMLLRHLPALLDGIAPRRPQDPAAGDLLPRRTPEMGVTDWERSARAVHDWVRALTAPYPGAHTFLDGRRLMLWATRVPHDTDRHAPAGTVLALGPDGVRIATGPGSVVVTAMSAAGEPPHPATAWCRAAGIGPGTRFDPVPPQVARWARGEGPRPVAVSAA